jgi:hypothetical protein
MNIVLHWPQVTLLVLGLLSVVVNIAKGDVIVPIIAFVGEITLLYSGGFFG